MTDSSRQRRIVTTVEQVELNDGHSVGMVVCDDHRLGLIVDGLLSAMTWNSGYMHECYDAYMHLRAKHGGVKRSASW